MSDTTTPHPAAWRELLDDWFLDADSGRLDLPQMRRWFQADESFDARLSDRWSSTIEAAARGDHDGWLREPDSALAWVVLLDQLPRNVWRAQARAFGFGDHALAGCRLALARGYDRQLPPVQRLFMYLPLEHDESLDSQREALALLDGMRRDTQGEPQGDFVKRAFESAEEHALIVTRFGRYPHRNEVLGRASTDAEKAWLAGGERGFGQ